MNRLLITGGSSYLGRHLVPLAISDYEVLLTYYSADPPNKENAVYLDVRDQKSVHDLVSDWRPEVVIHLAGSNGTPDMGRVIRQGAANVASASAIQKCRLIHLSSDVVFDGHNGPYLESDSPHPVHAYGRAKADAERFISSYDNHVIVRTSLIYGLEEMDHSTRWISQSLNSGEVVTLFDDQLRNPIWVETLSLSCLELTQLDFRGIINIAGRQAMSRYEYGMKLLKWWAADRLDRVQRGQSSEKWPKDCRLNTDLVSKVLSTPMLGLDQVLEMKSQA